MAGIGLLANVVTRLRQLGQFGTGITARLQSNCQVVISGQRASTPADLAVNARYIAGLYMFSKTDHFLINLTFVDRSLRCFGVRFGRKVSLSDPNRVHPHKEERTSNG